VDLVDIHYLLLTGHMVGGNLPGKDEMDPNCVPEVLEQKLDYMFSKQVDGMLKAAGRTRVANYAELKKQDGTVLGTGDQEMMLLVKMGHIGTVVVTLIQDQLKAS